MDLRRKRTTIGDIATRLGVSKATVSFALNDKGNIGPQLREDIKRLAAELNYVPNFLAQALREPPGKFIGVVVNYFSNVFFRDFYVGLEEAADAQGFTFMASQSYASLEKEKNQVEHFIRRGVDGLIVLPCSQESEHLERAMACNVPVVLMSNYIEDKFAAVVSDNARGAELATSYLLSLEGRTVVHIAGPQIRSSLRERREEFVRVCRRERPGLDIEDYIVTVPRSLSENGYRAMEKVIRRYPLPIALLVCNAEVAMGVLSYCSEHNLDLTRDISIACFSSDTTFNALRLPITTISVQAKRMGEITAHTVIDLIENPDHRAAPPIITMPVTISHRGGS